MKFSGPISVRGGPELGGSHVSGFSAKFFASFSKVDFLSAQTRPLNRLDIAPLSPEAPARNLPGFTAVKAKLKIEQTRPLITTEAVKEAEAVLRIAQTRKVIEAMPKRAVSPALESYGFPAVSPVLTKPATALLPKEEIVRVATKVVKREEKKPEKGSKIDTKIVVFVKDKVVNLARYFKLKAEIFRQSLEGKKISLKKAAETISGNDSGLNSGIKKKGPDGSIEFLIEGLTKHADVDSKDEADLVIQEAIEGNTAVDIASDGERAAIPEVQKVLIPKEPLAATGSIINTVLERISFVKKENVLVQGSEVRVEETKHLTGRLGR